MDRVHFLKLLGFSCVSASFPAFMVGCTSVHYIRAVSEGNKLGVKKSEFSFEKKEVILERRFIVVESPSLKFPVALYKKQDGNFLALSMECTHQGCEVKPHDEALTCPCHGSEFDTSGSVLEGPAEYALKEYNVSTDNQMIYVHLS